MKPFIRTPELIVRKPYRVVSFRELNTMYGLKLALELEEHIYILPESYARRLFTAVHNLGYVNTGSMHVTLMKQREHEYDSPILVFSCDDLAI